MFSWEMAEDDMNLCLSVRRAPPLSALACTRPYYSSPCVQMSQHLLSPRLIPATQRFLPRQVPSVLPRVPVCLPVCQLCLSMNY